MALAPTAAASPASADSAPPPDDMSPDAEAPEATEPECIATICRKPDGTYVLYAGDEPEEAGEAPEPGEGDQPAAEGQTFDTPQALLRGVMELLNNSGGAEDSFGKAFRGEPDATAMKPTAPMPGA